MTQYEIIQFYLDLGHPRGWLHLYDAELIRTTAAQQAIPQDMIRLRPVLRLAEGNDPVLTAALTAEMIFWKHASDARLQYYERHLKRYVVAVRQAEAG
jgi:hypothetical protein